jgi:hypothetical protein
MWQGYQLFQINISLAKAKTQVSKLFGGWQPWIHVDSLQSYLINNKCIRMTNNILFCVMKFMPLHTLHFIRQQ